MISNNTNFYTPKIIKNKPDKKVAKIDYFSHEDKLTIEFTSFKKSIVLNLQAGNKTKNLYTLNFSDKSIKKTILLAVHWLGATPSLPRYLPANCFQWPAITDFWPLHTNSSSKSADNKHHQQS